MGLSNLIENTLSGKHELTEGLSDIITNIATHYKGYELLQMPQHISFLDALKKSLIEHDSSQDILKSLILKGFVLNKRELFKKLQELMNSLVTDYEGLQLGYSELLYNDFWLLNELLSAFKDDLKGRKIEIDTSSFKVFNKEAFSQILCSIEKAVSRTKEGHLYALNSIEINAKILKSMTIHG